MPVRQGHRRPESACTCTPLARRRYLARLSGPLLDRVDVKVEFLPVGRAELLSDRSFTEPSCGGRRAGPGRQEPGGRPAGRDAVAAERRDPRQRAPAQLRPASGALAPLERAMDLGQISARGADRVIRLSWTLADLAALPRPGASEVGYALGLWLGTTSMTPSTREP